MGVIRAPSTYAHPNSARLDYHACEHCCLKGGRIQTPFYLPNRLLLIDDGLTGNHQLTLWLDLVTVKEFHFSRIKSR
jgi:hypothetical protein